MPILPENTSRFLLDPGFRWDGFDAYLFDIDGTLIKSRDRVHFSAFHQGILQATGLEVSLEGVPLAGNTDTAILREAFRLSGHPEELAEARQSIILDAMCAHVEQHRQELDPLVLPGVPEVLAHLRQRGAALGVATGNLERIGWVKLEKAGVRGNFTFGGFSDHFSDRNLLVASAAATARQLAGPDATLCVVGDTPRDIEAARHSNLAVIAVATGRYSLDELATLQPDACVSTLAALLAAPDKEAQ
jgi:phosphoglycolate phosphatase-like HAD superfamily hydrolase